MTLHAEEEMNEDNLSIFDVEHCILMGKIVERQRDAMTAEWKYRIIGDTFDGSPAEVIAKLSTTDKLVIIIVFLS
jgi:hypothetical protein